MVVHLPAPSPRVSCGGSSDRRLYCRGAAAQTGCAALKTAAREVCCDREACCMFARSCTSQQADRRTHRWRTLSMSSLAELKNIKTKKVPACTYTMIQTFQTGSSPPGRRYARPLEDCLSLRAIWQIKRPCHMVLVGGYVDSTDYL